MHSYGSEMQVCGLSTFGRSPCSPCLEYLQDVGPFVRGVGDLVGWLSGERRNEVCHIWSMCFVVGLEATWELW